MNEHEKINYLELPAADLAATKAFFNQAFNWQFQDYGPDYIAFNDQGIDGGFYRAAAASNTQHGAALIVFYSRDLSATQEKILAAGGNIIRATYAFPGGCRFHFTEPSGNEFAVWSDAES